MKVLFKQTAKFAAEPNKVFALGSQTVSEKVMNDPYFKLLKKAGLVVSVDDPSHLPPPVSMKDAAKNLVEKVAAEASKKLEDAKKLDEKPGPAQVTKQKNK